MENIPDFSLAWPEKPERYSIDYRQLSKYPGNTPKGSISDAGGLGDDSGHRESQARHRAHAARFAEHGLTAAEADIAAALVLGGRAQDCADARGVTMNTVRTLRRRAYDKLGVGDQVELMRRWGTLPTA